MPRKIGYVRGPWLMSALRKRWVLLRHAHADVRFEGPVYIGPGFSLHMPDNGTFVVGPDVEFRRGFRAEVLGDGELVIGAGARFTYHTLIQCSTRIEIGERVMLGQSTLVLDGHHRFRDITKPMLEQGYDWRPVRIADDAVVTTKCTVMADVGERSWVGANAVVTRPIPPYTVAVGTPARPIDYFGPPGQEPDELRAHVATDGG